MMYVFDFLFLAIGFALGAATFAGRTKLPKRDARGRFIKNGN